jgi:methylmalonyl-CoA mutase N-terminal domain/subunit
LALRTQQVIAYESGVAGLVDPLGGSYFVERLTKDMETEALAYFDRIDQMGGMVEAIERGFPQREIAESSYRFQQAVESRRRIIVGVNDLVEEHESPIETLYIDRTVADTQIARLGDLKKTRDNDAVRRALDRLRAAARSTANVMPPILDAVRAYATIGEMCDTLRDEWGEYEEVAIV